MDSLNPGTRKAPSAVTLCDFTWEVSAGDVEGSASPSAAGQRNKLLVSISARNAGNKQHRTLFFLSFIVLFF